MQQAKELAQMKKVFDKESKLTKKKISDLSHRKNESLIDLRLLYHHDFFVLILEFLRGKKRGSVVANDQGL